MTPDFFCFPIYLVNAESIESCFVCSEMGFISEQLCMKKKKKKKRKKDEDTDP